MTTKKIIITKRLLLDNNITNEFLLKIRDRAFKELNMLMKQIRFRKLTEEMLLMPQYAPDIIQCNTSLSYLLSDEINKEFKGIIPDIWSGSKKLQLPYQLVEGFISIEILYVEIDNINTFEMAINLNSISLVWLETIGDKLLLSVKRETQGDVNSVLYRNTFFLNLSDDLLISEYRES